MGISFFGQDRQDVEDIKKIKKSCLPTMALAQERPRQVGIGRVG